jgi:predicted GTPase
MVVFAGVDYAALLAQAEEEADVIVWDGGNNDLPFFAPDLHVVVVDPLRPGHELLYHPGEANLRMADVIVVNKVDSADHGAVGQVVANAASVNPVAEILWAASPVTLDPGPSLVGRRVLVVEDGPTITHGGMPYGAGTVAARQAGAASIVDPRQSAVRSILATYERYPQIGDVLPAMGYSDDQLRDLEETVDAADCDVVVTGTPIDLGRLIAIRHPIRHARYELVEVGGAKLPGLLQPIVEQARGGAAAG